ncbi:(2Fe-2S)-binding protein [uncultured Roseibium sp.]|uniref:(2Fe-2S)-binding protein n=1 Tax=uncultured Roseibium sp. TaxID=1936171 RepID=UPI0026154695|nr:(2Fe-2S)-binding protein [uncultured Roseibium sp.]
MADQQGTDGMTITLNGRQTAVSGHDSLPLLHVLREVLGLKGTRFGCGQGTCGACTVIVDGKAVTSCDLPLEAVRGKRIETVECLTAAGATHPLAEAVLACQAAQCGYCLPGILMAAKALLDREPDAPDARIREALDDNLCRCGAHLRILRAVRLASETMTAAKDR